MNLTSELKKIRCVIFDFDGVILDSSGLKTVCFDRLYRQYEGVYEDAIRYHHENKGMSRFRQFDYIVNNLMKCSDPDVKAKEMADKFADIVFDAVSEAPFIKGAEELLEFLSTLSIPLYVISSAPHDELEKIMIHRGLENYFKKYFGSVDSKDQYIDKILKWEKLNKEEVLYIGDTLKDLKAARSSGVAFCGVRNSLIDFSNHDCFTVADLNELKSELENL